MRRVLRDLDKRRAAVIRHRAHRRPAAVCVIGCSAMRIAVALSLALLVVGCGGGGTEKDAPRRAVTATVALTKATGGAPDGGTAAGHGNDVANATTAVDVFSFTGKGEPPATQVTARGGPVRG